MATTPQLPVFNKDATLGALEIANLAGVFLSAITLSQAYTYYRAFPKDGSWVKIMVSR